ncbi:aconitate hydratase AcnA [Thiohalorhabdus methylotrophus]|uniref:Aconitate hydratase n=1 Tax=Thiohalorhabdus methylotrophus TaxID=3242694 RepID=A0ABV4TTN8_9GAMM
MASLDSFGTRDTLPVNGTEYAYFNLNRLNADVSRMPVSLRVLLENLLRNEDGERVRASEVEPLVHWTPETAGSSEVGFSPARVLLQDFTGVPAVVDLAAMRDAMGELGGDPGRINPLVPAELVIDHSVQVDQFGTQGAWEANTEKEYERNRERYAFLRWGQNALDNFQVVPAESGIVHQVNLEYLARVVFADEDGGQALAYPDTLVGTDSHTTMINGLGVLGWGVGGIEAEAAMLGQPVSMLIPEVVGVRLTGKLPEGATATDLVLTITELLRSHGVVGKFVEFYGPAIGELPLADRATIANMAPEYGATMGFFPVDEGTLDYMRASGRSEEQVARTEAYLKAQGLFWTPEQPEPIFNATVEVDLSSVVPSLAGPKRPQDRVALSEAKESFGSALRETFGKDADAKAAADLDTGRAELGHGSVVIAAITSCTNTSNPSVMLAAGLIAKNAVEKGLTTKPWVKTSLAPGSRVVTDYLESAGLLSYLEELRFNLVGYGCTTCIGNSGPLPEAVEAAINEGDLVAASVLSGNRNFEGRIHAKVKANYLASPPLVVAYALAGTMDFDPYSEPLGHASDGSPVYLKDLWPSLSEVDSLLRSALDPEDYRRAYAHIFEGDDHWKELDAPTGDRFAWDADSTYIQNPPFFADLEKDVGAPTDIYGARCLANLGDSVTTDHISPAGAIDPESPAGQYLMEHGVSPADFNSYGARRGNHEVMMRGTFANVRLRNKLAQGREGGWTTHVPSGELMPIYDAAMRYRAEGTPLIVMAGREYGTGSSRDWAAKGPALLGVQAVIAESFERIHRSNLIGMGILPLEFQHGDNAEELELTGAETFDIVGMYDIEDPEEDLIVFVHGPDGTEKRFMVQPRLDTPNELAYFKHGGILPYVLRTMAG